MSPEDAAAGAELPDTIIEENSSDEDIEVVKVEDEKAKMGSNTTTTAMRKNFMHQGCVTSRV